MLSWLLYLLSFFTLLSLFWSYATAYISEKFSHFNNSRSFMCCFYMSSSLSWRCRMTHFIKDLLVKNENFESIVLMLKAKWSQMTNHIEIKWVKFRAWQSQSKKLIVEVEEMKSTAKLSYDHCKKYKQQEANKIIENWSWWHSELKRDSRVVHHRWDLCKARLSSMILLLSVLLLSVLLLSVLLLSVLSFSVSSSSVLSLTAFSFTYVVDTISKFDMRAYFLHDYVCFSWSTH